MNILPDIIVGNFSCFIGTVKNSETYCIIAERVLYAPAHPFILLNTPSLHIIHNYLLSDLRLVIIIIIHHSYFVRIPSIPFLSPLPRNGHSTDNRRTAMVSCNKLPTVDKMTKAADDPEITVI